MSEPFHLSNEMKHYFAMLPIAIPSGLSQSSLPLNATGEIRQYLNPLLYHEHEKENTDEKK